MIEQVVPDSVTGQNCNACLADQEQKTRGEDFLRALSKAGLVVKMDWKPNGVRNHYEITVRGSRDVVYQIRGQIQGCGQKAAYAYLKFVMKDNDALKALLAEKEEKQAQQRKRKADLIVANAGGPLMKGYFKNLETRMITPEAFSHSSIFQDDKTERKDRKAESWSVDNEGAEPEGVPLYWSVAVCFGDDSPKCVNVLTAHNPGQQKIFLEGLKEKAGDLVGRSWGGPEVGVLTESGLKCVDMQLETEGKPKLVDAFNEEVVGPEGPEYMKDTVSMHSCNCLDSMMKGMRKDTKHEKIEKCMETFAKLFSEEPMVSVGQADARAILAIHKARSEKKLTSKLKSEEE